MPALVLLLMASTEVGTTEELIASRISPSVICSHLQMILPYDKAGLASEIRINGKVLEEEYRAEGVFLDAQVDIKICHKVQDYIVKE